MEKEGAAQPLSPRVSPTAIGYRLPLAPAQHRETKTAIDTSPPQTGPSAAELLESGVLQTYFK